MIYSLFKGINDFLWRIVKECWMKERIVEYSDKHDTFLGIGCFEQILS